VILVAGGTGRLGTLVVRDLAGRGMKVRVLTRDRHRARHLDGIAADIVEGDVRRPAGLAPAVAGAEVVVSAVQGFAGPGRVSPRSVDRDGNAHLIAAAADAGADVVMVSVVGASPGSPMELFRCKHAAEQQLRASGVAWTIVRATALVELWAEIVGKGIVFGRGDNPINFVSVGDVAATVSEAVVDAGLRGQLLEIGGPRDLSFNELAAILRELRGRPERVRHIPQWLLRAMAPLHRQSGAALAMDTIDMRFHGLPNDKGTDIREALAGTAAAGA
jgi:uncharacterized protein YbjT (DUF2867 family)